MSATRGKSLTRLWTIVEALRTARRGLTVAQLTERTGGSRASIYRDFEVLRDAGVPIDKVPLSGEMRHVLALERASADRAATPLQVAALLTARRSLSALEGTRLVREFDALLREVKGRPHTPPRVHLSTSQALAPDRLSVIDRAMDQGKCLRIRYRGTNDAAPSWRNVEPVELRVSAEQPYLVAFDRAHKRYKTYKLARLSHARLVNERATAMAGYKPEIEFAHSRGIWSGEAHEVLVRLDRRVARFAAEWPLHRRQSIEGVANGDVLVRARVAGLAEPLRWALSWGRRAEVLQPPQLREMVIAEFAGGLNVYRVRTAGRKRVVSNVETGAE